MGLINELLRKTEKIDFLFPNDFDQLMTDKYYDYDKFEWFLYYVFQLEGVIVQKVGKKGKGDGGADLIINIQNEEGYNKRIGIQAKYWKNRVGSGPINQLASAKQRLTLSELWIITTSDLTSDAKEIAESLKIKILRAEDVKNFIEVVKKHHEKEMNEKNESRISFLPVKEKPKPKPQIKKEEKVTEDKIESYVEESLRSLRLEIAKKHKLFPVYNVFNNNTLAELSKVRPKKIEDLKTIQGIGEKKIEQFGKDLVDFFNKKSLETEEKLFELLISERPKIAKFNNLKETDVYNDKVIMNLIVMKPTNIETLKKVYGFEEKNIKVFGDYLVRKIASLLEENKK